MTVFDVPGETSAKAILDTMRREHHIMLAGSFDSLAGQVIRIGHMGTNANFEDMDETMKALDATLRELGVPLAASLAEVFEREYGK